MQSLLRDSNNLFTVYKNVFFFEQKILLTVFRNDFSIIAQLKITFEFSSHNFSLRKPTHFVWTKTFWKRPREISSSTWIKLDFMLIVSTQIICFYYYFLTDGVWYHKRILKKCVNLKIVHAKQFSMTWTSFDWAGCTFCFWILRLEGGVEGRGTLWKVHTTTTLINLFRG